MEAWMNDVPAAVRTSQRQLRTEVPDLAGRYARLSEALNDEVSAVRAEQAQGGAVPEIRYADVMAGKVSPAQVARIKRRGCVVIRGVFDPAEVDAWNEAIVRYIDEVRYLERMSEKAGLDKYFSALGSNRPQIFSLYWSRPQMQARQHPNMAATRAWLNRLWVYEKNGTRYFDPDRQFNYADRIRRREPGDSTLGLSPHSDGGSVERWCEPTFRHVYREVFEGDPLAFDPFDAEGRIATREIPSPAVCSAFRTFQGWTALTRQGPGDGTLRLIPIAKTTPWMLLRALQPDVPEGDLCGAQPGRALGASPQWHAELLAGLVPIPRVDPGDTVWWHSDVIHAVEDQHTGKGYSNVIYIGAAPWCDKNAAFAQRQAPAFLSGRSSPDFAAEDYELDFAGRSRRDELTPLGQMQMGLRPWS
ncbi:MAG TPA: YbiU family protein [Rhizobacter sp.]|nr:YbiU family protein [Rhizobacter sp.]